MQRLYDDYQKKNKELDDSIEEILEEYEKETGAIIHAYSITDTGALCIFSYEYDKLIGIFEKYLQLANNIKGINCIMIINPTNGMQII